MHAWRVIALPQQGQADHFLLRWACKLLRTEQILIRMEVDATNRIVGNKLRGLRAEKDYSRQKVYELTKLAGTPVPVITLRRFEDGERAVPIPTLLVLCGVLEVNPGQFMDNVQSELQQRRGRQSGE